MPTGPSRWPWPKDQRLAWPSSTSCEDSQGGRWHLLHACRADLLRRLGRTAEAGDAYRAALALDPPPADREFLTGRLAELDRLCKRRKPWPAWRTASPPRSATSRRGTAGCYRNGSASSRRAA